MRDIARVAEGYRNDQRHLLAREARENIDFDLNALQCTVKKEKIWRRDSVQYFPSE